MSTEALHRGGRGCLPRGAAGTIVLIVLVEFALAAHASRLARVNLAQYQFARHAAHAASASEVLCFGDSQIKMGLAPRVIEAVSGQRAFNLALAGSVPPASYLLLRRVLDLGARPRALVIGYHPDNLKLDPGGDVANLSELFGARDGLEFAFFERSAALAGQLAAHRLLPSYHHRNQIRAEVLARCDGKPTLEARLLAGFRRNWGRNQGAQMLPRNGEAVTAVRFWDEPDLTTKWWCNRVNAYYLQKFLGLAERRGIPVFWLVPPMHPRIAAERERLGHEERLSRFLDQGRARHPRLVVLDSRASGYPARFFVDSSHLDRRGATALSLAVADALGPEPARVADGPRWLDLPAARERSIAVMLEDLDESTLALKAKPEVAR